jgi:hypothetical protein
MSRHSCITLPDDSVVINGDEYDFITQELSRLQRENAELKHEIQRAELACDEWERKNGDAPHRVVNLAGRIRVNAGLHEPQEGPRER